MENNINMIVHLSDLDKALFGKLLSAVEALNASLWFNEFSAAKRAESRATEKNPLAG